MFHLSRGTTSLGIFAEKEVRDGLRSGRFALSDIGWREGMGTWQPLSQFAEFAPFGAPPPQAGAPFPSPPATAATRVHKTEPLAIWSLVLSIVSVFACGFIFGVPGRDLRSYCSVSHSQKYKFARARHSCRRSGHWMYQYIVVADLDYADTGNRDFETRKYDCDRQKHARSSGRPSDQDTAATVREHERIFSNNRARIASAGDAAAKRSPPHSLVSVV